eukprot:TRINITY_DN66571_c6_g1_i2.p1 TRINITY_DN66571_c6_g1~~TRINITY_DN66571_c6_g1_i2.p1  ORF type:complete len:719 (+),score=379.88 TRINITY_DN66571_c6_g1_i2:58-2214(+)
MSRGAQYHCDYCRKDISSEVRIRCAECSDFDLCLECFSVGVEVFPHKNWHKYRVMDHVTTPLFDEEWGADEELLLLEAIEMYGLGNWSDVADHVSTKSRQKCEQHYYQIYLTSRTAPLPDTSAPLRVKNAKKEEDNGGTGSSGTAGSSSSSAAAGGASGDGRGSSKSRSKQKKKKESSSKPKTGLAQLVGFMPKRGDFDTEYENDAELILADMQFKPEDTQLERELKLKVIEIYNSKLDQRAERKQFILQRGLLQAPSHSLSSAAASSSSASSSSSSAAASSSGSKKSSSASSALFSFAASSADKRRTKAERELADRVRVFARFHSKEEHERFVEGLINEQRLRRRIEQLQNQRLNGVRTLADGELFEAQRKKRLAQLATGRKKESSVHASYYKTPVLSSAAIASAATNALKAINASGSTSSSSSASSSHASSHASSVKSRFEAQSMTTATSEHKPGKGKGRKSKQSKAAAAAGTKRKHAALLDVTHMEDIELLSDLERKLCSELRMIPRHYIIIKDALLRECFKHGFLLKDQAEQLVKIDIQKTGKIFDFFVSSGWVTTVAPPEHPSTNLDTTGAPSSSSSSSNADGASSVAPMVIDNDNHGSGSSSSSSSSSSSKRKKKAKKSSSSSVTASPSSSNRSSRKLHVSGPAANGANPFGVPAAHPGALRSAHQLPQPPIVGQQPFLMPMNSPGLAPPPPPPHHHQHPPYPQYRHQQQRR